MVGRGHPLERGHPPRWACGWGEDQFGVWVEFGIDDVVQRMRWIYPGRFAMGSPVSEIGRFDDEGPQHLVSLTEGFWLADTPCTQAMWSTVVGSNPSNFKGATRPVEQLSWDDCQRFLERLNERRLDLESRLPTEAEWEYACRAGTKTGTYVGDLQGDEQDPLLNSIAWYHHNSGAETHPVGEKAPNPWGLYDMLGNVWEWCADGWEPDAYSQGEAAVANPLVQAMDANRVYRGGSWFNDARYVRAAYRHGYSCDNRGSDLGIRLARGQGRSSR